MREVRLLKRRALDFLEEAKIALRRGSYDIACFLAEQALQLYLKFILLKIVGDYPRTHSIKRLLGEIARLTNSSELRNFMRVNRARISALEDAYLMARYFIKEYDEDDANDMIKLVEEIVNLVNKIVGEEL